MTIIYILIAIFIITGIILILQAFGLFEKNNIKHINSNVSKNSLNTIENNINVLDGNSVVTDKSSAIISLINYSYFYVQTLVNEGNNYDDKAQTYKFKQLLSKSAVKDLKHLEGSNGKYSF